MWTLAGLILVSASLIYALRYKPVQTYFAKKAAAYLSKELGTTLSLEGLYFQPFSSLVLNGLFIADTTGDTLLYANQLRASVDLWKLRERRIIVKQLAIADGRFSLVRQGDRSNLSFIIDYFFTPKKTTGKASGKGIAFAVHSVALSNISLAYQHVGPSPTKRGIDFNNILLTDLSGNFSDIDLSGHVFKSTIKNLQLRERSGFLIRELNAQATVDTNGLELQELYIETNRSILRNYLKLDYQTFASFSNFSRDVAIQLHLDGAQIHSGDIAFFAPDVATTHFNVNLSGAFSGRIPAIKGKRVRLQTGSRTRLSGDLTIRGLPDIDQTVFDMQLDQLSTNSADIESLVPQLGNSRELKLPSVFERMGGLLYQGTLSGHYYDFVANGLLETELGAVNTDINLNIRDEVTYSGQLSTDHFDLGVLLQHASFGHSGFDIAIEGKGFALQDINSVVTGKVQYLDFKDYRYQNLNIGGRFAERLFRGAVGIDDPNLQLQFDGDINFNPELPEYAFHATVDYANLLPLHLYKKSAIVIEHATVNSNFMGNTLNDIQGDIAARDLHFQIDSGEYKVDSLVLLASGNKAERTLALHSDIAQATLHGEIDLTGLRNYFRTVAMRYAPSMELDIEPAEPQSFDFNLLLKNVDAITALLAPKLALPEGASMNAHFSTAAGVANFNLLAPRLSYANIDIDRLIVDESANSGALRLFATADRISIADSLYVNNVNLSNVLANDSLHMNLKLSDASSSNRLDFNGLIGFEKDKPIKMQVLPSTLVLAHEYWQLDENALFYLDEGKVEIQGFEITNNHQIARLEGVISNDPDDRASLTFRNFDLAAFNSVTQPSGVKLRGVLDGRMDVSSVLKNPYLLADIAAKTVYVNETEIGDISLQADFDRVSELVNVAVETNRSGTKTMVATGTYDVAAEANKLNIAAHLNQSELILFQPFLNKLVSDVSGTVSADLRVTGSVWAPQINGTCYLHDAGFTVNYLQTPYRIDDEVTLANSTIVLDDLVIVDPANNKAIANGTVDMRNPLIPQIDVVIDAVNFLVLNTTFRDNPLYYGTAYGTGKFIFRGPTNVMDISIQARTEEHTRFYIPLNATGTVSDNDFIRFVNSDTLETQRTRSRLFSGLSMNMDLQITPSAETSLYTDLGELTGRGEGLLSLRISSLGDFEMFGDYTINSGKFTFTAQDFINKIFDIQQGGSIRWTGQPTDATVNLAAVYGQRTSLGPLYNAAGRETVEQRVLAHAVMNLNGNLMRPDISFALDFPNDPYVKDELQSYLSDANNVNQQALSLIVRRSFVPGSAADFSRELNNTLLSAGTELAFNQLNNLIAQSLNLKFVDLNIRSLNDASASVRLFNDRLIFTGGVTDRRNLNDLNVFSDRVVTDAELLYLIRKDGRLVLRGSNRLNSRNFLPLTINENYVSALGLVYRQEFYTFQEFFRRLVSMPTKRKDDEQDNDITEP